MNGEAHPVSLRPGHDSWFQQRHQSFQQLSEYPTRIMTSFCLDCLKNCGSH